MCTGRTLSAAITLQCKLLYTISNSIEVYEEPVSRTKKIPHHVAKFEAGEEHRIVHECLYWLLCFVSKSLDAVVVVDALCELILRFRSHRHLSVKVYSHLASKLTFASAFASNFNIVSMVMLTLMQRLCTEPIL